MFLLFSFDKVSHSSCILGCVSVALFTLNICLLVCGLGLFEVVDRRAKLVANELSDEQPNLPVAGID